VKSVGKPGIVPHLRPSSPHPAGFRQLEQQFQGYRELPWERRLRALPLAGLPEAAARAVVMLGGLLRCALAPLTARLARR
jgi:hypothetical protein